VWNAAILKGQGRGKKLASWRGTRYCDVVRSPRKFGTGFISRARSKLPMCIYKACRIIILHVVLYGCETWSLTLREVHRLREFENWVLRRIFGLKRDDVVGGGRKLHQLYFLPSVIRMIKSRRMRWAKYVTCMGRRGIHTGFWERQEERDH
jgi:hypothetical protein